MCVFLFVVQAGQYIKAKLVEGDVYQRVGLWVQGAPNASLQEQVRGPNGLRHATGPARLIAGHHSRSMSRRSAATRPACELAGAWCLVMAVCMASTVNRSECGRLTNAHTQPMPHTWVAMHGPMCSVKCSQQAASGC
jgi:hypothetical protein